MDFCRRALTESVREGLDETLTALTLKRFCVAPRRTRLWHCAVNLKSSKLLVPSRKRLDHTGREVDVPWTIILHGAAQ